VHAFLFYQVWHWQLGKMIVLAILYEHLNALDLTI